MKLILELGVSKVILIKKENFLFNKSYFLLFREFLYFCIRSSQPMMKTFSVLSALTNDAENVTEEKNVKEAWFHVPRRK